MTRRPTVVLIEDDDDLGEAIRDYLANHGFAVTLCRDGERGVTSILKLHPDVVVLDLMLPGIDGFEVCRRVRKGFEGPVLMLTARDDDIDEVAGLETGADDYVRKPVRPRVLLARLQALLRRGKGVARHGPLQVGDLVLYPASHRATLGEVELPLSTAEFEVLLYLVQHAGVVVERATLYREVRGFIWDGLGRSDDLRVSCLRKKLGPRGEAIVRTIRGSGYLLAVES